MADKGPSRQRDYWPSQGWRTADPEQLGMRSALLAAIGSFALDSDPPMSGIVVIRGGYLVFEHYFRGFHERSYHAIASITKSVLSALVGIALSRSYLAGLDQPVAEFFLELDRLEVDPRVRGITVRHLLSMTAGWTPRDLEMTEFANNAGLVATALQRPMSHDPGTSFWYDNLGAHLLSVLLSRATSMSTAEFGRQALLGPLGIWTDETPRFLWKTEAGGPHTFHRFALWDEATGLPWKVDPSGYTTGYAGLHLTVRDMATFGYLFLNGGWWDGAQLVPHDYVQESARPQSTGGPPGKAAYGYLWWTPIQDPHGMYFGLGFGGQYLYVVPDLDLVVAIASAGGGASEPQSGNRPSRVLDRFVRPAAST